jgi:hypothetical protein
MKNAVVSFGAASDSPRQVSAQVCGKTFLWSEFPLTLWHDSRRLGEIALKAIASLDGVTQVWKPKAQLDACGVAIQHNKEFEEKDWLMMLLDIQSACSLSGSVDSLPEIGRKTLWEVGISSSWDKEDFDELSQVVSKSLNSTSPQKTHACCTLL